MSKVILKEARCDLGNFLGSHLLLSGNGPSLTESVSGVAHHFVGRKLSGVGDFRNEGHWGEAASHFTDLLNILLEKGGSTSC